MGSNWITYQERKPKDVPIYIGATGMKMMELTGEIADGAVLNYLVSPTTTTGQWTLCKGAEKAGRSIDEIDRPQPVACMKIETLLSAWQEHGTMPGQQPHIMKHLVCLNHYLTMGNFDLASYP